MSGCIGCQPTRHKYIQGCRCEGAKQANRDYCAEYYSRNRERRMKQMREYSAMMNHLDMTICPVCGKWTSRPSGFCRGCEKRI